MSIAREPDRVEADARHFEACQRLFLYPVVLVALLLAATSTLDGNCCFDWKSCFSQRMTLMYPSSSSWGVSGNDVQRLPDTPDGQQRKSFTVLLSANLVSPGYVATIRHRPCLVRARVDL